MLPSLTPTVTVEDAPVPSWVRPVIEDKSRQWHRPDCLVVAWTRPRVLSEWRATEDWVTVSYVIDGEEARLTMGVVVPSFAAELTAGRHVFVVAPGGREDVVAPVTLDIGRGTVVVIDARGRSHRWLRWLGGGEASVAFPVFPHGFAHNDRWGQQWGRRLGWETQDGAG